MVMTVGGLSRRTGVTVKTLREYEDMGLIYTVGRSAGNYRLFDEEALRCVGLIGTLRGLGLTLAEIRGLAEIYLRQPREPIGARLAGLLGVVRARTQERITEGGRSCNVSTTLRLTTRRSLPVAPTSMPRILAMGSPFDSPPGVRP